MKTFVYTCNLEEESPTSPATPVIENKRVLIHVHVIGYVVPIGYWLLGPGRDGGNPVPKDGDMDEDVTIFVWRG